jgi:hypothetical protein
MLPETKAGPMVSGIKYLIAYSQPIHHSRTCIYSRQEVVEAKWVVVQHQSPSISDNLEKQTAAHACHKPPGLVPNTKCKLQQQDEAQYRTISGISREVWQESYLAALEGARLDGASGRVWWAGYVHRGRLGREIGVANKESNK